MGLFSVKQRNRIRSRGSDPSSSAGAPGSASDGEINDAREGRITAETPDVADRRPRSEDLRAGPGIFCGLSFDATTAGACEGRATGGFNGGGQG